MADQRVVGCFAVRKTYQLKRNVLYVLFFAEDRVVGVRFHSKLRAYDVVYRFGKIAMQTTRVNLADPEEMNRRLAHEKEVKLDGLVEGNGLWTMDWSKLVGSDKQNFQIPYAEIKDVKMASRLGDVKFDRSGIMKISTFSGERQYDVCREQRFQDCVDSVREVVLNALQSSAEQPPRLTRSRTIQAGLVFVAAMALLLFFLGRPFIDLRMYGKGLFYAGLAIIIGWYGVVVLAVVIARRIRKRKASDQIREQRKTTVLKSGNSVVTVLLLIWFFVGFFGSMALDRLLGKALGYRGGFFQMLFWLPMASLAVVGFGYALRRKNQAGKVSIRG